MPFAHSWNSCRVHSKRWSGWRNRPAGSVSHVTLYSRFGVVSTTARGLANAETVIAQFPTTQRVFAPSGSLLRTGDRLVQRDLGASLATIAQEGAAAFYRGDLTQRMLRFAAEQGVPFSARDFSEHRTLQLEPVLRVHD